MPKIRLTFAAAAATAALAAGCSPVPSGPFPASIPPHNGCGASMVIFPNHNSTNMFDWSAFGRGLMTCYGPNVVNLQARVMLDRCWDDKVKHAGGGIVCTGWQQRAASIWVRRNMPGGPNPHGIINFQDGLQAESACRLGNGQFAGYWRVAVEMKAHNETQHVVQRSNWRYLWCG